MPVAGHAVLQGSRLRLDALVAAPDGSRVVRAALEGKRADAAQIGTSLAEHLLAAGAGEILSALGVDLERLGSVNHHFDRCDGGNFRAVLGTTSAVYCMYINEERRHNARKLPHPEVAPRNGAMRRCSSLI